MRTECLYVFKTTSDPGGRFVHSKTCLKVNMSIVCAHSVNATSFFRAGFYVTSSNVTRER